MFSQVSYPLLWATCCVCWCVCSFYDSIPRAYAGLKHSDGRQEVDHNCVCINGYLQPQPFLERIYPLLTESDDGFVDRLLVCFPKEHILMEEVRFLVYHINYTSFTFGEVVAFGTYLNLAVKQPRIATLWWTWWMPMFSKLGIGVDI